MKVLHICLAQYSNGWTYQENLLTKYHLKMGLDVVVLTSMYCYSEGKLIEDSVRTFVDINGVRVIRLKKKKDGFLKKMPVFEGLFEKLVEENPDIIFMHGCQYIDVNQVIKYKCANPRIKLFVDNHADYSNSATNFLSKEILHKIIWKHYAHKLIPYTEKFWGVMPSRVEFMVELYNLPKEKCNLLVMGADDDLVKKSSLQVKDINIRGKYGIENEDFLIVTGGKIDNAKIQVELLMKAVLELKRNNVKLLVFGSIDEKIKDRIMTLVDGKNVIYAGWITPDESYDYFAVADLVCFPGRHSVFWEQAAGQGKPLLVKDWNGTHHVDLGGNVEFICDDSVDEIKFKLKEILDYPGKYQKMQEIAENKGKPYFSYRNIARKSIDLNTVTGIDNE